MQEHFIILPLQYLSSNIIHMKKLSTVFFIVTSLFLTANVSAQEKSGYKIINRIHLDGDGGWDYLTIDDAAGILYVSHGTMVQVVDVKTGKQIAVIDDTKGVHGISIAPKFNKGYISCGKDSSVVVFDIKTFKTLSKIKISGANPDAILFDAFSKKVFAFNGRSNNVTVIDAATDKEIASIPVDGKPEFAATDERGKVYVNIEDKSTLCVINTQTLKVEQCWPVAPVEEPSGLAIDTVTHRLFSVSDGHMAIIDARSGAVIDTLPIGDRVDGVAFDTGLRRAYTANGDGTVTVVGLARSVSIDRDIAGYKYKVLETVKTQKGARTIAVDSKTHHIYLPTADFGDTPAATADKPHPRPSLKPGTFTILEIAPVN